MRRTRRGRELRGLGDIRQHTRGAAESLDQCHKAGGTRCSPHYILLHVTAATLPFRPDHSYKARCRPRYLKPYRKRSVLAGFLEVPLRISSPVRTANSLRRGSVEARGSCCPPSYQMPPCVRVRRIQVDGDFYEGWIAEP